TINIDPDAETLAETAALVADMVQEMGIQPRVAMLSFSNFGDAHHPLAQKVARATKLAKKLRPGIEIEGEMQADVALQSEMRAPYPFSDLTGPANILVFPNLAAGNIAYKLLGATGSEVIGPMVLGTRQPVNVVQQGANVSSVVHMTTLTVARAIQLSRATRGAEPAEAT
ncbi:MAG: phosphate acyltransferase, partial [Myxococcota bacterium]